MNEECECGMNEERECECGMNEEWNVNVGESQCESENHSVRARIGVRARITV
jgi:hypothetical protein